MKNNLCNDIGGIHAHSCTTHSPVSSARSYISLFPPLHVQGLPGRTGTTCARTKFGFFNLNKAYHHRHTVSLLHTLAHITVHPVLVGQL